MTWHAVVRISRREDTTTTVKAEKTFVERIAIEIFGISRGAKYGARDAQWGSVSYLHPVKIPMSGATLPLANAHSTTAAQAPPLATSPELEQTLVSLTSHRSVLGYMLLSRGQPVSMIRHSGVVFEGEQGKKYASAISRIVESVQAGLEDVSGDSNDVCSRQSG